ncbi:hypothetical protein ACFRH8_41945, partial [Streptomyces sp. NPDC056707]
LLTTRQTTTTRPGHTDQPHRPAGLYGKGRPTPTTDSTSTPDAGPSNTSYQTPAGKPNQVPDLNWDLGADLATTDLPAITQQQWAVLRTLLPAHLAALISQATAIARQHGIQLPPVLGREPAAQTERNRQHQHLIRIAHAHHYGPAAAHRAARRITLATPAPSFGPAFRLPGGMPPDRNGPAIGTGGSPESAGSWAEAQRVVVSFPARGKAVPSAGAAALRTLASELAAMALEGWRSGRPVPQVDVVGHGNGRGRSERDTSAEATGLARAQAVELYLREELDRWLTGRQTAFVPQLQAAHFPITPHSAGNIDPAAWVAPGRDTVERRRTVAVTVRAAAAFDHETTNRPDVDLFTLRTHPFLDQRSEAVTGRDYAYTLPPEAPWRSDGAAAAPRTVRLDTYVAAMRDDARADTHSVGVPRPAPWGSAIPFVVQVEKNRLNGFLNVMDLDTYRPQALTYLQFADTLALDPDLLRRAPDTPILVVLAEYGEHDLPALVQTVADRTKRTTWTHQQNLVFSPNFTPDGNITLGAVRRYQTGPGDWIQARPAATGPVAPGPSVTAARRDLISLAESTSGAVVSSGRGTSRGPVRAVAGAENPQQQDHDAAAQGHGPHVAWLGVDWVTRRASAPAARLHTERFDPARNPIRTSEGVLDGRVTLIRAEVRRIQTSDNQWVRDLTVTLPIRPDTDAGVTTTDLTTLRDRLQQAADNHLNTTAHVLPRSGDRLHLTVELLHSPTHPEHITLTHTTGKTTPARADQLHWDLAHPNTDLLHEILHYTGLPDEYHDPDTLFRHTPTTPAVHTDGPMTHTSTTPNSTPPQDDNDSTLLQPRHLKIIENTTDSGPTIHDHPLNTPTTTNKTTTDKTTIDPDPDDTPRWPTTTAPRTAGGSRSEEIQRLFHAEWNALISRNDASPVWQQMGSALHLKRVQAQLREFQGKLTAELVAFVLSHSTASSAPVPPTVLADLATRPALLVRAVGRTQGLARVTARRPELLNVLAARPHLTWVLSFTSHLGGPATEGQAEVLLTYPQVVDAMERQGDLRWRLLNSLQLVTVLEGRLEVIEPVARGYGLPLTVERNPGLAQALLAARSPAVLARSLRNLNSLALAI